MKRKNLIIGFSAFILAICSAFASPKLAPQNVSAMVKMNVTEVNYTCRSTNATCNNSGIWTCTVSLSLQSGSIDTTPGWTFGVCTKLTDTDPNHTYTFLSGAMGAPYDVY